MLNAIGLANPGIDAFLEQHLPRLAELGVPLWVSVGGFSLEDYVQVAGRLATRDEVEALELNLSCPNVDEVPENVGEVVAAVRAVTDKPLYAKLSAAVADLGATARAAEAAGADGLSLVNTVKGFALDERTLQPVLARGGGRALRSGAAAGRARGRAHVLPRDALADRRHGRSRPRKARARAPRGRRERRRRRHRALRRPRRGEPDPRASWRPSWRRSASPVLTTPSASPTPRADVDPRPGVESTP